MHRCHISNTLQTRQKIKEAYDIHFAATIERAEKQIILARHGRRLINLLDDTPVVPGDVRPAFENASEARQVLNDAEADLQDWQPNLEPVTAAAPMGTNLMPAGEDLDVPESTTITESDIVEPRERETKHIPQGDHLAEATGTHDTVTETAPTAAAA